MTCVDKALLVHYLVQGNINVLQGEGYLLALFTVKIYRHSDIRCRYVSEFYVVKRTVSLPGFVSRKIKMQKSVNALKNAINEIGE